MAKVRLGVSGLGRGAMLTVPGLAAHPRVELVAGFDPSAEARAGLARAFDVAVHDSFEGLLADGSVDAVYVASPHELHAGQAIAAARAGKHLLVEKPMAVSLADARAMVEAAEASGVRLLVGPSHGYDPPVALAARTIAERGLGRVRMIAALAYTDFLYRPRRPEELDTARGGGVVHSQATHQIDVVRRLVGGAPVSVRARRFDLDPDRRADGAFMAMLFFAGGATASLTYSGYARYDSDALSGWIGELGGPKDPASHAGARARLRGGDEAGAKVARGFASAGAPVSPPQHHEHLGFVLASCERGDLELTPGGVVLHGDAGSEAIAVPLPNIPRAAVGDALAAAILDGEPPLFDGRWGLETLACVHAILLSADDDREVALAELLQPEDLSR